VTRLPDHDGVKQHLRDVYGPAHPYDVLPEGTTIGTVFQFVGFSIGWNKEHLLQPDEADKLADLLRQAAAKCRMITDAENRARAAARAPSEDA
jgi:hypothetical protein